MLDGARAPSAAGLVVVEAEHDRLDTEPAESFEHVRAGRRAAERGDVLDATRTELMEVEEALDQDELARAGRRVRTAAGSCGWLRAGRGIAFLRRRHRPEPGPKACRSARTRSARRRRAFPASVSPRRCRLLDLRFSEPGPRALRSRPEPGRAEPRALDHVARETAPLEVLMRLHPSLARSSCRAELEEVWSRSARRSRGAARSIGAESTPARAARSLTTWTNSAPRGPSRR